MLDALEKRKLERKLRAMGVNHRLAVAVVAVANEAFKAAVIRRMRFEPQEDSE